MFAATLITLRETLEASLVVGIVLAFLQRTGQRKYDIIVWLGVFGGMIVSFILALVFQALFGGFTGAAEQIYEGITMLVAAALLTWMIVWMIRQRRAIRSEIEGKVSKHVAQQWPLGIFALVLVSTAREGIETVIFLNALLVHSHAGYQIFGGIAGIVIAIGLSYFLFRGIEVIPMRKFFAVTGVLLILFAAGLVSHGIHEFQEAGLISVLSRPLWDINPPVLTEGIYPLLHDHGMIGGFLRSLFGYTGSPSGLEVIGYLAYILGISWLWRQMSRPQRTAVLA